MQGETGVKTLLESGSFSRLGFPEPTESEFRHAHRESMRRWVRLSILVSACTVLGFSVIDNYVLGIERTAVGNLIRFVVHIPAVIVMLVFTWSKLYQRGYDTMIQIVAPVFGVGTVLMAAFAPVEQLPLIGSRLLLVAFFFYFMLGLRFWVALRINALVMLAFLVLAATGTTPARESIYMLFTLFCANLIGAAGSYALEFANRREFLERRLLHEVATHDGLTGLLNRAAFEDEIRRLWNQAQRDQQPIAVIMADIDCFKAYNDSYGHQAGDDCLRRVALAVESAARRRPLDFVARYGGEELVAVLYGADRGYAESVARNMIEAVSDLAIPHAASLAQTHVTISAGLASVDASNAQSHDIVIQWADKALYVAKDKGRNRYVVLDPLVSRRGEVDLRAGSSYKTA
ncbi:MAG TPA: diguanylate cyclase [Steroidobacteraceae bacterium]|nr:diguanylate cyclase [Steroidobacteraceae bacterium]